MGKTARKGSVFLLQDKTYATKTWANIKGRYYYFDKNGFRRQGLFRYRNGKTYYLGKKGAMVTGWQKIRKHWYYFGKNGAMKKASWIRTKTGYAYVDAKGKRVVSSWVKVKGKKYYIDEKGVKVTKSRYIGNKAYYFDKKGVYHKDKKIKERLINPKGKMVALTFDDGSGPYTDRLLKCLKNNRAGSDFLPGWDEYRKLSGYDTADGEAGMRDRKSHLGSCKPFIFKRQFHTE